MKLIKLKTSRCTEEIMWNIEEKKSMKRRKAALSFLFLGVSLYVAGIVYLSFVTIPEGVMLWFGL